VNYDNSLVVTITVTRCLWSPSSGDHFIYMWRHLQAATISRIHHSFYFIQHAIIHNLNLVLYKAVNDGRI